MPCLQLLNTIRVLTNPDDLPPIETGLRGEIVAFNECTFDTIPVLGALDMAAFVMEPDEQPDLVQGLQEGMQATGNIVLKLIEGKDSFNRERAFLDCQTAQSEVYPHLSRNPPGLTRVDDSAFLSGLR